MTRFGRKVGRSTLDDVSLRNPVRSYCTSGAAAKAGENRKRQSYHGLFDPNSFVFLPAATELCGRWVWRLRNSRMTGHRMMYFDGKILLCGGSGTDFFNVYDIHSRRWTRPQARVGTTLRSVASAQFGREGAVDEYLVYGQHLLLRSTISEHAAIPCSKGLLILFGSSRSSALLVPR